MAVYYISGHGSWRMTDCVGPAHFNLPKGTTVTLYTPNATYMSAGQSRDIMRGSAGALPADQIIKQYLRAPNLCVSPSPETYAKDQVAVNANPNGGIFYPVNVRKWLYQIAHELEGNDLHWGCCRALKVNPNQYVADGTNRDYFPGQNIGVGNTTAGLGVQGRSQGQASVPIVWNKPK